MNKIELQYKLINNKTKEETICNKVVIKGFNYYINNDKISLNDPITDNYRVWFWRDDCSLLGRKKVLATNNPNIDINKVINNDEELALSYEMNFSEDDGTANIDFKAGYNKAQEISPFSDDDMINFSEFIENWLNNNISSKSCWVKSGEKLDIDDITTKELLNIWKEQQIKTIYYE